MKKCLPVKNYHTLKFMFLAAAAMAQAQHWCPPPIFFTVFTLCVLLTRDLFALAKFVVRNWPFKTDWCRLSRKSSQKNHFSGTTATKM